MKRQDWKHVAARLGEVDYGQWAAVTEMLSLYHLENDADRTLLAHVALALLQAQAEGHVCLDVNRLAGTRLWTDAQAEPPREGFQFPGPERLHALLSELSPVSPDDPEPLKYDPPRLYTRRMWTLEQELAERLGRKYRQPVELPDEASVRARISQLFKGTSAEDVDWQRVAVAHALRHALTVLTGGPGTGKTTTVTRLLVALAALSARPVAMALAAPTGKAAQRLTESIIGQKQRLLNEGVDAQLLRAIPEEACTVHRLLGVRGGSGGFIHGEDKPLDLDVLVVDEVSMLDLPLMTALFRALPDKTRVILIGDPDQLPAVGVGGILAELVREPDEHYLKDDASWIEAVTGQTVPVSTHVGAPWHTALYHSRRFDPGSGIGRLARALQNGQLALAADILANPPAEDLCWHPLWEAQTLLDAGKSHWRRLLQAKTPDEAFEALKTFRVLTPLRQGPWGVEQLNPLIEQHLGVGAGTASGPWYQGRPIMVTRNHYGVGLFNGDVGLIWEQDGQKVALFESESGTGYRTFPVHRLPEVETVFAMTIHKTQGSEFDEVLMLLPEDAERLLSRELIFTGLTRAKRRLTLLASADVWQTGVERRIEREGGLRQALERVLR